MLVILKAAVDFEADLRNHDALWTNDRGYVDIWTSRDRRWLSRLIFRLVSLNSGGSGDRVVVNDQAALPDPDRQILTSPERQTSFRKMLFEPLRCGPQSAQHDACLEIKP